MRFTFLAFALVVLSLPVAAQDRKDVTPQASTSILINAQPIKGKVLEIDGKHYVAVEDLAQSLRGTISYGDGQIALTLSQLSSTPAQPALSQPPTATAEAPSSQPPSMAAQPPETGRIKGNLTYFFNVQTGTSPTPEAKSGLLMDVLKSQRTKSSLAPARRWGPAGTRNNTMQSSIRSQTTMEILNCLIFLPANTR